MQLKVYTHSSLVFFSVVFSLFSTIYVKPAKALMTEGDITTGIVPAGPGAGKGTFDLCTHSNRTDAPNAVGPNNVSTGLDLTVNPPKLFNVGNCKGNIVVGKAIYNPIVGFQGKAKPAVGDSQGVQSTSGGFQGLASQDVNPGNRILLGATGVKPNIKGATGEAAGQAIDPFTLSPGVYQYAPIINKIQINTDQVNDFAGVTFFASDSRFSDPLWNLTITAEGLINSVNDLQIDFTSNPILGLSNNSIVNEIKNNFTVLNSAATLNNLAIFDVSYNVDQDIIFAEGTSAGIISVPEPSDFLGGILAVNLGIFLKRQLDKKLNS